MKYGILIIKFMNNIVQNFFLILQDVVLLLSDIVLLLCENVLLFLVYNNRCDFLIIEKVNRDINVKCKII